MVHNPIRKQITEEGIFPLEITTYFKGIAIFLIVVHNYLHFQPGFGIENEMLFSKGNTLTFLKHQTSGNIATMLTSFFGYFGHYGVQLFLFFSAYGLTIQFGNKKISSLRFVGKKLKKIYFLLAFGILIWMGISLIIGQPLYIKEIAWKSLLVGTGASGYTYNYLFKTFSGPFWFFGLIIQFYLLFPLLYKLFSKVKEKHIWILFLGAYLIIYTSYYLTNNTVYPIFGNVFGHLPEIFLGIYIAQNKLTSFKKTTIFLACLIFLGSQFVEVLFPFSFLAITIVLLSLGLWLYKKLNKYVIKILLYIGQISMILFVVNGPFRYLQLFDIQDYDLRLKRIFLYLILLFFVSHILYKIYSFLIVKMKLTTKKP